MNTKQLVLCIAKYCGLFWLSRQATADRTRVLAYHGIWLGSGPQFGNFLFMAADKFSSRMSLLSQWGYPVVSLSEAIEAKRAGLPLPAGATVLTIDDGWYGTYTKMLPALEHHNFPATVYLSTYYCRKQNPVQEVTLQYLFHSLNADSDIKLELAEYQYGPFQIQTASDRQKALHAAFEVSESLPSEDARQSFLTALAGAADISLERAVQERWFHFMSPEEVADAAARGLEFELHTHRHRIEYQGASCLAEEISLNRTYLNEMTGGEATHFCYPSGEYEPEVWPTLIANNVLCATTTDIGLVGPASHDMALPRILDGQDVSDLEFEAEMSGFLELTRTAIAWLRPSSQKPNRATA